MKPSTHLLVLLAVALAVMSLLGVATYGIAHWIANP